MHRFLSSASLLLLAAIASGLFSASTAYAQDVECNPSFVSVSTGKIRVLPSGGDDTDNLQCAVLEAGRLSLPRVELAAGDFSFTRLFFDAYRGTFGGTSADSTRMTVIPNSVDCGGAGQSANLVVVSGGDTKISRVRIDASNPCRSGSNFAVIAFVQPESEPACQRRTFFGEVDRVEVIGSASQSGRTVAISNVPPQQCFLAGQGTLGTFKVNRSTIEAFAIAIATQIWGQGQVDINFNSIDAVGTAIFIVDADQSTTITGNSIRYNGGNPAWTNQSFGYGVLGSTFSNGAPAANRTVIHNNRFFDLGVGEASAAVETSNFTVRAAHSIVITGNTVVGASASDTYGVLVANIDAGTISDNTFTGSFTAPIFATSTGGFTAPTADWGVFANAYRSSASISDVVLTETTSGWIVNGAGASITDLGQNTVIP